MSGTVAIIQARMGSTRLPGKVLMRAGERTLLELLLDRVRAAKRVDQVVVATTDCPQDEPILELCGKAGVRAFAGSEADVLDRYHHAARSVDARHVIRITADCPLLDPRVVDAALELYDGGTRYDYVCNFHPRTYPDGQDVEVFSRAALDESWRDAPAGFCREHVTPFIRENPGRFRLGNLVYPADHSKKRWTVDYPEDLEFVSQVIARLAPDRFFSMEQILDVVGRDPKLEEINRARA